MVNNSNSSELILAALNQNQLFVKIGASVDVHCTYLNISKSVPSSKINCSKFFWEWNGGRTVINGSKTSNQCVSVLKIHKVLWLGKQNFRCIFKGINTNKELLVESRSLTIISGYEPQPLSKLTLQWIEDELEVSWVPATNDTNNTVRYTVEHYNDLVQHPRTVKTIHGNCGYFKVNNCSEKIIFYCRASFFPIMGATYMIRIIAENKFGKQLSEYAKKVIPLSQQEMMLKPVSGLTIILDKEGVKIKWKDDQDYLERKKISYSCEGNQIQRINFTNDIIYEISHNNLPAFQYCEFCVSRQRYRDGQFSCATCQTVRTAEHVPQAMAELISCHHGHACPTRSHGNFRNVTISWKIPEKQYLNGILRRQIIFYYAESDRVLRNITIKNANITTWTLEGLRNTEEYHVYIVICNLVGCSSSSTIIYIRPYFYAAINEDKIRLFSDKANTGVVIGVPLAVLGVCFAIIFVILYLKRHEGERLPPIQEPDIVTDTSQLSALSTNEEYDTLEKNDEETEEL